MKANKIYFDSWEENGEAPAVWIVLADAKVATQVKRKEMFSRGMFRGCFLETKCYPTREQAKRAAFECAKAFGCRFVDPDEFERVEKEKESERVSLAFAEAERLIREG